MTPREALVAIETLEKFGINLGLGRVQACLGALGDPHRRYPTVHVGGTNGKGSTTLLTAAVLTAAGYRTGLYTSPPLESFGERIRVDGVPLPDADLPALYEAVLGAAEACPAAREMTQFEVITALAFLHYARVGVDAAVIEVGMGGRLDSTNVIVPEVSVVTNVGLEHAEHLGPTVTAIAGEKAGIVKPGVPLVTTAEGEALAVLEGVAAARGAPCHAWGRDFAVTAEVGGTYRFEGRRWRLEGLALGLRGSYQRRNLGAALGALETLAERGWRFDEGALRRALAEARWPGRLELLGPGPRVLLDGAHNPHASRALAEALGSGEFPRDRLVLVLGILGDKDARSILGDLVPLADEVWLTRSASVRARAPGELLAAVEGMTGAPVNLADSVGEAVDRALAGAGARDLVCVTGSLTTVGEARGHLRRLGWVR